MKVIYTENDPVDGKIVETFNSVELFLSNKRFEMYRQLLSSERRKFHQTINITIHDLPLYITIILE